MRILLSCLLCFALIYLWGCVIPKSNHVEPKFYLLNPIFDDRNDTLLSMPNISFHVNEVNLPPYLDDNRLVSRVGNSGISYRENSRWGEPIGEGIARVLSLNLSSKLGTLNFSSYPHRPRPNCTFEVFVKILRFERIDKDKIKLDCIVDIYGRKKLSSQKSFEKTVTIVEEDIQSEIESISLALLSLSNLVAQEIYSTALAHLSELVVENFTFQNAEMDLVVNTLNQKFSEIIPSGYEGNKKPFVSEINDGTKITVDRSNVTFGEILEFLSTQLEVKVEYERDSIVLKKF